jgi:hypothetical protein
VNRTQTFAELSQYGLEVLRRDEEFILYRGENRDQSGSSSVPLLAPVSTQPSSETLRKLEYEFSLRNDLDSIWAIRPQAMKRQRRVEFTVTNGLTCQSRTM